MTSLNGMDMSCGVGELSGITQSPEETLLDMGYDYEISTFCMIVFSDKTSYKYKNKWQSYGAEIASFIVKNKLGTIISSKACKNSNSGNNIKVWIWHVDKAKYRAWIKKQQYAEDNF